MRYRRLIYIIILAVCIICILHRRRVMRLPDYSELSELEDGPHMEKREFPNGKVVARDMNAGGKKWLRDFEEGLK